MNSNEAISHVTSSAKYWAGDTIDDSYYSNNLGLQKSFECAVKHVKDSHSYILSESEIELARMRLNLN